MNYTKILNATLAAFKQKFMSLCQNSDFSQNKLDEIKFANLTSNLMESARTAGQAGLKEFLQKEDIKKPTIKHKDKIYRFKGTSKKSILTLFGEIKVSRFIYGNEENGGQYYVPLDTMLGMYKDDYATLETREMILFASCNNSPHEVNSLLSKASLCCPSRTAIQNIIRNDGSFMEKHHTELLQKTLDQQEVPSTAKVIVASMDGANVLLREPGKKKGRKGERPTKTEKESKSSYRNAMVGSVSFYEHDENGNAERIGSMYTSRMPQEKALDFKINFECMISGFEEKAKTQQQSLLKILLCDGHRTIWNYAKNTPHFQDYKMLIDFYHTTEHLSKAAEAIYGKATILANRWYYKWRTALKKELNAANGILRSMKGYLKRTNLSKTRIKALKAEITFFKNNKKMMPYAEFINLGLPIGSGPIEAAAKTIVKQRMCRSGMRWNRKKGQHILTVRAYARSGCWEQMWNVYKQIRKAA